MKKIFNYIIISLFITMVGSQAIAQSNQTAAIIYGIITDSLTKEPLGLATINLKTEKDSLLKTTLSKGDGKFSMEKLQAIKYHIVLVSTGYEAKMINVNVSGNMSIDLKNIYLTKRINSLKEVEVKADRPIVQQKSDRIIYDLQADPESKVNSVLGMIHKIPYLSVDANDNVLMKGNTSFKVLINGKPSGMLTNNLKEVLRSMPASTVVRIEVITIPPSKYDAEGMAGIINIITNKKVNDGYKGTFNVNENLPQGGPGVGGSFTAQEGKFGINSYVGASDYNSPQTSYSNNRTTTGTDPSVLQQNGLNKSDNKNAYFGTDLSYEIDSLNLLSGTFNINGYRSNGSSSQTSALSGNSGVLQGYDLDNGSRGNGGGMDASINYQLGFKSNKNTLLTFSYQYSNYGDNGTTDIGISNPVNYPTPDYNQYNNEDSKEHTFQIDYVQPIKKVNMEAGVKAILRSSKSDSQYNSFNSADSLFEVDPDLSNNFNYTQNVFGAYNSYHFSLKKWNFSAGVRAEETNVNADFVSSATTSKQNYFNVIPTLSVNVGLKNNSSISFGFTQRLRRPSIYRLNPFVDRSNPDIISTGNPNLRPVLMNIIQAGYNSDGSKKLSFFIGSDYMFFNNLDLPVTVYDPNTNITKTTYENSGKGGGVEINFNVNYSPVKFYNISLNGNVLDLFVKSISETTTDKLDRV